jgi:hypothetical protein
MHKYARERIGYYDKTKINYQSYEYTTIIPTSYTQIIQPWQFGDNEQKSTCLWLKNLSPLKPLVTQKPGKVLQSVHREGPSPDRWKNRSRTFQGIANAMALQWG